MNLLFFLEIRCLCVLDIIKEYERRTFCVALPDLQQLKDEMVSFI